MTLYISVWYIAIIYRFRIGLLRHQVDQLG